MKRLLTIPKIKLLLSAQLIDDAYKNKSDSLDMNPYRLITVLTNMKAESFNEFKHNEREIYRKIDRLIKEKLVSKKDNRIILTKQGLKIITPYYQECILRSVIEMSKKNNHS